MNKYKRFMVFRIIAYYPSGGIGDCEDSFDTLKEAETFSATIEQDGYTDVEIFDREEGIIVKVDQ